MKKEKRHLKETKNVSKWIIIVLVCIVIILGSIIIFSFMKKSENKRDTVVSSENVKEITKKLDDSVPSGHYEVTMNVDWVFNRSTSNAYVENSLANSNKVYFDISIPKTNEIIYSSPFIPVGEKIQNFKLDETLEPGEYDGLVTYYLVDQNDEVVDNLSVQVKIRIEE